VNAALPFSLIATAELHLTASMAAVLIAAQPLFATLIEAVLLAQPASPRRAAGLTLGLAGVAVLVGWAPGSFDAVRGWSVAASLLGALCYATGGIYARRRMRDVPPLTLALGQQLGAAVWLVPPALLTLQAARPAFVPIAAMFALALVSTAMAYVIFFRLLAEVGPVRAFTVTYVIPVFGVIWGVLVLGERPAPGMIAGLAAIVLSLLLVNAPPPARAPAVVRAGA
jgi:drug/metabolite transporter (DMT)-like permease